MLKKEYLQLKQWPGFHGVQAMLDRYYQNTTEFDLANPPIETPEITKVTSIFLVFDHAGPKGFLTKTKAESFITFCSGNGNLIDTIKI